MRRRFLQLNLQRIVAGNALAFLFTDAEIPWVAVGINGAGDLGQRCVSRVEEVLLITRTLVDIGHVLACAGVIAAYAGRVGETSSVACRRNRIAVNDVDQVTAELSDISNRQHHAARKLPLNIEVEVINNRLLIVLCERVDVQIGNIAWSSDGRNRVGEGVSFRLPGSNILERIRKRWVAAKICSTLRCQQEGRRTQVLQ